MLQSRLSIPCKGELYEWFDRWSDSPGLEVTTLAKGDFFRPVVSPDGRWLLVSRTQGAPLSGTQELTLIEVASRSVNTIKMHPADIIAAVAWAPKQQRFIVVRARRDVGAMIDPHHLFGPSYTPPTAKGPQHGPEFFLLDPEHRALTAVDGEFEDLWSAGARGLQSSIHAGQAWVARPDNAETSVGLYDLNSFSYKEVTRFPSLQFKSTDMLVDEARHRLFAINSGHVLELPLP